MRIVLYGENKGLVGHVDLIGFGDLFDAYVDLLTQWSEKPRDLVATTLLWG